MAELCSPGEIDVTLPSDLGARAYDVFGTANFFNFKTWAASIEYLLSWGIEQIADYDSALVSRFINGIDLEKYELISPQNGPARSTLIFISHRKPDLNHEIYETLKQAKVDIAYRRGNLRLSPHLYNTADYMDRVVSVLNSVKVT